MNRNSNFPPSLCDTYAINRDLVCAFFELWSFENYTLKFRPHFRHKILCSFSPSPSTHLLVPSSSYPWLPMVMSLFLTHLLLEVASPIIFPPPPFRCHWSSRSKGLHWWRRSKAYKLHMELHHFQWKAFLLQNLKAMKISKLPITKLQKKSSILVVVLFLVIH